MLDCGNSKTRSTKKHKSRDSSASVVTSASGSHRSARSRYESSKHCIESDVICELIDTLRYSGRGYNDSGRNSRMFDYLESRRNSGYRHCEKVKESNCRSNEQSGCDSKSILKFDGGNSASAYESGPIFDFGSSAPNVPEPVSTNGHEANDNNSVCSGR